MKIRVGYELAYEFPQSTPMILTLNVHHSRASDLVRPDYMVTTPSVPIAAYRDGFGNWCNRLVAPQGRFLVTSDALVNDSGAPDITFPEALQHMVPYLPEETLVFLLGSRYCETDRLTETAWKLFAASPLGWGRVQAICDFVHKHIEFGYQHASPTKTALGGLQRSEGRLPRFRASRRGALPLHEHSRALLHGLSRRHRPATSVRADGFRRLVRGLSRRRLAHV